MRALCLQLISARILRVCSLLPPVCILDWKKLQLIPATTCQQLLPEAG